MPSTKFLIAFILFIWAASLLLNIQAELPPCPTEDSVSCHWDAQNQGNGIGRSFDSDVHGNITFTDN